MQLEALHAARLAQLDGALCSLLREASDDEDPNDVPDGVRATLNPDGSIDIEYTRGGIAVAGECL